MPNPIDIHVGRRVREARAVHGISQEQLGKRLGISFQQVQKYEKGTNRIGSSRLWMIANALEVPIDFFFDGLERESDAQEGFLPRKTIRTAQTLESIPDGPLKRGLFRLLIGILMEQKASEATQFDPAAL